MKAQMLKMNYKLLNKTLKKRKGLKVDKEDMTALMFKVKGTKILCRPKIYNSLKIKIN